jgi:1-acyl-sn-glycerol-3-phosphate acyltransferase
VTFYAFSKAVVGAYLRTVFRMRVRGAELVPRSGPLIVACNHVSYLDPPALGCAMPRPVTYMAKHELFRIPLLGAVITGLNAFPVDRSRGDVGAIKRSVEKLRGGAAIGIFPEGTRNASGVAPAQYGVALLASLSGAPVVPAYVDGTADARRLARITVTFGAPIEFRSGKARREDLAKWTDEIMARIFALKGVGYGGD